MQVVNSSVVQNRPMSGWDRMRSVNITKFELLCLVRQYAVELSKDGISEDRVKSIIGRMTELRNEFAK